MDAIAAPSPYRLARLATDAYELPLKVFAQGGGQTSPSLSHLCLLVFEAVLEVVCVSLPGYIIARLGQFDADKQKFLANLNVSLFTPCLIFTKLASQLSAEKLSDLAIIPAIFVVQTLVSWTVAIVVAKLFRFNRRASNFVIAMGVFGNSNSLPISLVLSLSQTIAGLHWDRIPGDNDDEVGARGILYLLIFQQLGQLVRWSWGYHVLLAPKERYLEYNDERAEEGQYRDDPAETPLLIEGLDGDTEDEAEGSANGSDHYNPPGLTPVGGASRASEYASSDDEGAPKKRSNGHQQTQFPALPHDEQEDEAPTTTWGKAKLCMHQTLARTGNSIKAARARIYRSLPRPAQVALRGISRAAVKVHNFLWDFMNPPLWAMLIAVLVASIPALQQVFFEEGSFVKNSVTSAIKSSGGVAVPLILVVLGANLARNTMANPDSADVEEEEIGTKLLVASLLSRMLLPTIIMTPILALLARYVNVSILDDPIFVIVCFLLVGAPSALQLAQICQINNVYEKTMGRLLFQSYVIWILPSTLMLVMLALEVIEWARL
ncbi:Auxin Efflux Carrier superfamily [Cordyceps fumosorosea ARSEF 2679]|uniref:Auxin Efflux Carrier superfamily n=1 Tax=Cordyceps fumosorosea (strain ARSEF 2679) TaxID=1081104 RepID=A0A167NKV1_CORFA|nr:Auxin Efflux Carrier superfamily [Cordyceps fumosorosea ARSEF 2679]OAA55662.1 Auxin Efflux Carrier superfamily [Cordyceps fumosorosea ARSEF 2679]